ncbi:hypothetical protein AK812_SmicGene5185 [Symbiodinium microadriaticum]|uniref:Uncharacterized protein n=1 Tax=Symbiodinium microadriaticum TaxID=2951 RepID=A0A1Q9EUG0_SYMMI|nr:hypothetical protein AK812_SmicGene5185 [Symbiodinium microadriaticum]
MPSGDAAPRPAAKTEGGRAFSLNPSTTLQKRGDLSAPSPLPQHPNTLSQDVKDDDDDSDPATSTSAPSPLPSGPAGLAAKALEVQFLERRQLLVQAGEDEDPSLEPPPAQAALSSHSHAIKVEPDFKMENPAFLIAFAAPCALFGTPASTGAGNLFGTSESSGSSGSLFGASAPGKGGSGSSIFSIPPPPADPDTKINIFGGATEVGVANAEVFGSIPMISLKSDSPPLVEMQALAAQFPAVAVREAGIPSSGALFGLPAEGASTGQAFESDEKPNVFAEGDKTPKHQDSKAGLPTARMESILHKKIAELGST